MRQDKFTTKFQEALGEAQSIAVGNDHQYIEPVHLLVAMLRAEDGGARSLLSRAGVNVAPLAAAAEAELKRLPQVSGTGGQVQVGRDLVGLLNQADKEAQKRGDAYIASEMFLLALADDKGATGKLAREHGMTRKALDAAADAVRGGQQVGSAEADGQQDEFHAAAADEEAVERDQQHARLRPRASPPPRGHRQASRPEGCRNAAPAGLRPRRHRALTPAGAAAGQRPGPPLRCRRRPGRCRRRGPGAGRPAGRRAGEAEPPEHRVDPAPGRAAPSADCG